jgi:cytochrome c peroxidase
MVVARCTDRRARAAGIAAAFLSLWQSTPARSATDAPFYSNSFQLAPSTAGMTALGRDLFFDRTLSASRKISCSSCHDPKRAFGPTDDSPLQGTRAAPSLMYTQNVPPFTEHYSDDDGDDSVDQGPAGGRMWDGRAQSAHEQARLPLFSSVEMANGGIENVIAAVRRAPYAAQFRATFGGNVLDDPALAFKAVLLALETFQQSPAEFYPYSSKYDAWLRGEVALSAQESRGLAAFNDASKGNCARCHPSGKRNGAFPQFTDFGYAAVGVPRNKAIAANADVRYYDLGLCGPLRTDLADRAEYCGFFRTPTLRNVVLRRVFFHNGVFHRIEDAVRFYSERDTRPDKWYSRDAHGDVRKFDDVPRKYQSNVDMLPPFDRQQGERSALSEADIEDLVAFLNTLTDGYK